MRPFRLSSRAATLGALIAITVASWAALAAESGEQAFDLHSGQELTFPVTIADGKVTLGAARPSKFGAAQPNDGEMTVGLSPRDKTPYEQIVVTEKTPVAIDFVATGLNGATMIDERVICGRLDAPASMHIGAASWRVRLHEFEARKEGATCE
ncbi:MAG TPA: hypothetical protein VKS78_16400 [Roseiarcus sp.]|nr:hypothetical protein [Roseiarcus sp.]